MTEETLKDLYRLIRGKVRDLAQVGIREAPIAETNASVLPSACQSLHVQTMLRRLGLLHGKRGLVREETQACLRTISREVREGIEEIAQTFLAYTGGPRGDGAQAVCGPEPKCHECPVAAMCRYHSPRPTIKSLPEDERPRERLIRGGEDHLSDAELLAIIIRDGTPRASALDLARELISRYRTFRQMAEATIGELCHVKGIGSAKAAQIKAALTIARRFGQERLPPKQKFVGPEEVFRHFRERLRDEKKETFWTVLLDQKNQVIREECVSVGSLAESLVHPREVFKSAVRDSAASVLFVHNHPSGDPQPSLEDLEITRRLVEAGRLMGIQVLDHIIIGGDRYVSLKQEGRL